MTAQSPGVSVPFSGSEARSGRSLADGCLTQSDIDGISPNFRGKLIALFRGRHPRTLYRWRAKYVGELRDVDDRDELSLRCRLSLLEDEISRREYEEWLATAPWPTSAVRSRRRAKYEDEN